MADREMLELAAKAAGYPDSPSHVLHYWADWNPITDDADAMRLAVKLRLEFEWWKNGVSIGRADMPPAPIEHIGDDPYAATRRAIVRAAAEIGKGMKDAA